ncbi:MAG: hypothetical protein ACOYJC_09335 [Christensenellales bacterium]
MEKQSQLKLECKLFAGQRNSAPYTCEEKANNILQEEYASVAWDEYLDAYGEKAMDSAAELYLDLHNDFQDESEDFLTEIEKILSALETASCFTTKWKVSKVNPEIDNT